MNTSTGTLQAAMHDLDLVTDLARAAAQDDPLRATTAALRSHAGKVDAILEGLAFLSGLGSDPEQSFYRSPAVSFLKVKFIPGHPTPPHDHGTWAAILLLAGEERNTLYQRQADTIREVDQIVLRPGDVLPMRPGAIHVVECASSTPTVGLHVYGGDLPIIPRSVWHPETFEEHVHTDAVYAELKAIGAASVVL